MEKTLPYLFLRLQERTGTTCLGIVWCGEENQSMVWRKGNSYNRWKNDQRRGRLDHPSKWYICLLSSSTDERWMGDDRRNLIVLIIVRKKSLSFFCVFRGCFSVSLRNTDSNPWTSRFPNSFRYVTSINKNGSKQLLLETRGLFPWDKISPVLRLCTLKNWWASYMTEAGERSWLLFSCKHVKFGEKVSSPNYHNYFAIFSLSVNHTFSLGRVTNRF